jgi:hypothetical protein
VFVREQPTVFILSEQASTQHGRRLDGTMHRDIFSSGVADNSFLSLCLDGTLNRNIFSSGGADNSFLSASLRCLDGTETSSALGLQTTASCPLAPCVLTAQCTEPHLQLWGCRQQLLVLFPQMAVHSKLRTGLQLHVLFTNITSVLAYPCFFPLYFLPSCLVLFLLSIGLSFSLNASLLRWV